MINNKKIFISLSFIFIVIGFYSFSTIPKNTKAVKNAGYDTSKLLWNALNKTI